MKQKQTLFSSILIESDLDKYTITQNEDGTFGVYSKRGIDTTSNGVTFETIQKALKYIDNSIKNDF